MAGKHQRSVSAQREPNPTKRPKVPIPMREESVPAGMLGNLDDLALITPQKPRAAPTADGSRELDPTPFVMEYEDPMDTRESTPCPEPVSRQSLPCAAADVVATPPNKGQLSQSNSGLLSSIASRLPSALSSLTGTPETPSRLRTTGPDASAGSPSSQATERPSYHTVVGDGPYPGSQRVTVSRDQRDRYVRDYLEQQQGIGNGIIAMSLTPGIHGSLHAGDVETIYFPPTGRQSRGTYASVPLHGLMTGAGWQRVADEVIRARSQAQTVGGSRAERAARREQRRQGQ